MTLLQTVAGTHCPYFTLCVADRRLLPLTPEFFQTPADPSLLLTFLCFLSLGFYGHFQTEFTAVYLLLSLPADRSLCVFVVEEVQKMCSQSELHAAARQDRKERRRKKRKAFQRSWSLKTDVVSEKVMIVKHHRGRVFFCLFRGKY